MQSLFDSLRPRKLTYFDDFLGLNESKRLCFISWAGMSQKGAISCPGMSQKGREILYARGGLLSELERAQVTKSMNSRIQNQGYKLKILLSREIR